MHFLIEAMAYLGITSLVVTLFVLLRRSRRTIKELTDENHAAAELLKRRELIHKEILDIAHYVALNMEFDKTLEELLPKLGALTNSICCAFYTANNASKLTLKHSFGFGKNVYSEFDLTIGEGFLGQLAQSKDVTVVHDVPDDTIYTVRTFLGKIKPRNIMVVPVYLQEQLAGVLVCASIGSYSQDEVSLVETVKYYLGVAVGNGINAEKNKRLSGELAFQNKLIQNQHEEMRKRLRDKELLIQHLINMIDDEIVYVLDSEYRVLYWGTLAKAIYGLPKEEAAGRNIDQVHGVLGWEPIENILQNMPEEADHCTWTTGPGGGRRFELSFSHVGEEGPVGFVSKAKEMMDARR